MLKVTGKYSSCRFAVETKQVKKGGVKDFAKCDATFTDQLTRAQSKGGASCPASAVDAAHLQLVVGVVTTTAGFTLEGKRFYDNNDGTITDFRTGLMWEKKDGDDGVPNYSDVHDVDNLYSWSEDTNWPDGSAFVTFLATLNDCYYSDGDHIIAGLGGFCDWRLPTIAELQATFGDPSQCSSPPCVADPVFLPVAFEPNPEGHRYWSAISVGNVQSFFAQTFDYAGAVETHYKGSANFVRAVRSGVTAYTPTPDWTRTPTRTASASPTPSFMVGP